VKAAPSILCLFVLLSAQKLLALPYPGVPRCDLYRVTVGNQSIPVFQNACPTFEIGKQGMLAKDEKALSLHAGRSISWTSFELLQPLTIEVVILKPAKVKPSKQVRVFPSRHGVKASVDGRLIRFTISKPGQYSVEIGDKGYRNGLMIFADPPETDRPNILDPNTISFTQATPADLQNLTVERDTIVFKEGLHDIGIYTVPHHVRSIYLERGAWVDGAFILKNNRGTKIYGRGVLSSRKLDYRAAHGIEALQTRGVTVEGLVVADFKHFGLRMIGTHTQVKWIKVVGAWLWNMDGISVRDHSTVQHCFIWANDDAIKPYRHNITFSDVVVWQLDNGGTIQLSWGNAQAHNVVIRRIDVLRADWDRPGFNRGLLNCVGNRYKHPDVSTSIKNWLIEDVVTETPVPAVFKIAPYAHTPVKIEGITLRNWKVKMKTGTKFRNEIIGISPETPFSGFTFDNVVFNGTKLTQKNWKKTLGGKVDNLQKPTFK
jgi:hypothetical protein